jgi:hypothetical protein
MLYKNGQNLKSELINFINKSDQLYIFSAYIKLDALKYLIEGAENVKSVCVRWEPRDLIIGVSDLDIYPYLKERGIILYRNPRLHLKSFIDSYNHCFIGSANISNRALDISNSNNYNHEIATTVCDLQLEDRLYFYSIEQESILITDKIYQQLKEQLPLKKKAFPDENDFELNFEFPDKHFLISALPMSQDVETFLRIYETREAGSETELNCAMHDLALYGLPLGDPLEIILQKLKGAFFKHPFIKTFLSMLELKGEIYFGEAKDWIHKNCADVPLPRKGEITENIQILYKWTIQLGDGKYKVDIPGSRSERLSIV